MNEFLDKVAAFVKDSYADFKLVNKQNKFTRRLSNAEIMGAGEFKNFLLAQLLEAKKLNEEMKNG